MDQPLYEKIADQIEQNIKEGMFIPGSKIPSVRKSSKQLAVSVATVLQAYGLLEDRGIIKARPQKGYFVQEQVTSYAESTTLEVNTLEAIPAVVTDLLYASQNPDITQFGAAIPDTQFLPIRQLQRSVGRLMRLKPEICAAYEFVPGSLNLRRQIAIRMLDAGYHAQPDEIVITLGCQNALMHALQATTQPGDIIAIETPTYHGLLQAVNLLKLKAIEIPCHIETGLDLDALEQAISEWPVKACVVTPSHQNPTGSVMDLESRKRLLKMCKTGKVPIIEDDVYGELNYHEQRIPSIKSLDGASNVIYCSSFSKSIAPGFRIGWIIAGKHQQEIEQLAYVQSLAIPTLNQKAIASFLENGAYDRHLRKTRQIYAANLQQIQQAILQHFPIGTFTSMPKGGFLLWIELPKSINALTLYELALKQGIGTMPGVAFDLSQSFTHHLRMNYAINWDKSTYNAIRQLGQLIENIMK
ncbi:PLP-dependent aminotransferase family protein [Marinomonas agarivorans]|nr:PLP-dependent aminotransferase family protein [Marinomonas agarivorans]